MLRIGLTGGIGSGKTTVANMFAELGAPIIDADQLARELTKIGSAGYDAILAAFGDEILMSDQNLNRKKLRNLIFKHEKARLQLEQILHPLIIEAMQQQLPQLKAAYCIVVIPLLVETSQSIDFLDRICMVISPEAQRITWAAQRDHVSVEEITAIMKTQSPQPRLQKIADDVIENVGSLENLKDKVQNLHAQYLQMSKDYA